jgi:hypothetical protein
MGPCVQPLVDNLVMVASQVHCPRTDSRQISYEKGIRVKLSGTQVYYTAFSLLVTLKNSRCKLHYQEVVI